LIAIGTNICDGIEIYPPTQPTFQGVNLLTEQPYSQIKEWFQGIETNLEDDGTGLIAYTYGIALYASYPAEPVKNVYVFERGHYDGSAEKVQRIEAEIDRRLQLGLPIDHSLWDVLG
jgi:hypothetical protein